MADLPIEAAQWLGADTAFFCYPSSFKSAQSTGCYYTASGLLAGAPLDLRGLRKRFPPTRTVHARVSLGFSISSRYVLDYPNGRQGSAVKRYPSATSTIIIEGSNDQASWDTLCSFSNLGPTGTASSTFVLARLDDAAPVPMHDFIRCAGSWPMPTDSFDPAFWMMASVRFYTLQDGS